MDRFVSKTPGQDELIPMPKLQAQVVITSLLMGSKVEELDDFIPYVKHLLKYYGLHLEKEENMPSWDEIIEFERTMGNAFQWDLLRCNAFSFL